jgi:Fur family ferric uptake transcriptional regulator
MSTAELDRLLRLHGLKATPRRRLVASYLLRQTEARTPDEIRNALRRKSGTLGLPTVYRILEELTQVGLLTRVELPDRNLRYAACHAETGGHHHHVVCTKCGRVGMIPECSFERQIRAAERRSGFRITGHTLQAEGLCPECR